MWTEPGSGDTSVAGTAGGVAAGRVYSVAQSKASFCPVLSNVSHDFMITVGQCAGRDWSWLNAVQVKIIITVIIIIVTLKKNRQ